MRKGNCPTFGSRCMDDMCCPVLNIIFNLHSLDLSVLVSHGHDAAVASIKGTAVGGNKSDTAGAIALSEALPRVFISTIQRDKSLPPMSSSDENARVPERAWLDDRPSVTAIRDTHPPR